MTPFLSSHQLPEKTLLGSESQDNFPFTPFPARAVPHDSYSAFHRRLENTSEECFTFPKLVPVIPTVNDQCMPEGRDYFQKDLQISNSAGPTEGKIETIPLNSCDTNVTRQGVGVKIAYFKINKILGRSHRKGQKNHLCWSLKCLLPCPGFGLLCVSPSSPICLNSYVIHF